MKELNLQDSLLIDNYLRRKLNEVDQVRFDERMKDATFLQEFEFRSSLRDVSEEKGNELLYTLLEEESERLDHKKPNNKVKIYLLILALLAIAGLSYLFVFYKSTPTNEELFLAHYEAFPNLLAPTERSAGSELKGVALALYAYDVGDFNKAMAVFDTLSKMNLDLNMYHAVTMLESGQTDRAEQLLITLVNDDQAKYQEAAEWYLCLLYLKNEREIDYQKILGQILSNSNHKYFGKAVEIKK